MTKVIIDGIEYAPVSPAQPEPKGPWEPKAGRACWVVRGHGAVLPFTVLKPSLYIEEHKRGLVYPTKKIAEKASPLIGKAGRLIALAFEADPDAGPWAEDRQWSIYKEVDTFVPIYTGWGRDGVKAHTHEQAHEWARLANLEGL